MGFYLDFIPVVGRCRLTRIKLRIAFDEPRLLHDTVTQDAAHEVQSLDDALIAERIRHSRALPGGLDQRSLAHFCPMTLNRVNYQALRKKGLPLFTNFLLDGQAPGHREVFSIFLAVHEQEYRDGHPVMTNHLERLPIWSEM